MSSCRFWARAASFLEDGIDYEAEDVTANVTFGSLITGDSPGVPLDSDDVGVLYDLLDVKALEVRNLTTLTEAAVPAGKTLTLTGAGNTFGAALDLSTDKGTLIVDEGATLTGGYTLTANAAASNITIDGTLALGTNGLVGGRLPITRRLQRRLPRRRCSRCWAPAKWYSQARVPPWWMAPAR